RSDLDSSPPRRSSDLVAPAREPEVFEDGLPSQRDRDDMVDFEPMPRAADSGRRLPRTAVSVTLPNLTSKIGGNVPSVGGSRRSRDRKSTRLNSSHQII